MASRQLYGGEGKKVFALLLDYLARSEEACGRDRDGELHVIARAAGAEAIRFYKALGFLPAGLPFGEDFTSLAADADMIYTIRRPQALSAG